MLKPGRQRGFNIIEVVTTIAVLGILIATAMPSMTDWIKATHVRNMAETTQAGLQRARTEAMKRNRIVTFWLVTPNTTTSPDDTCAQAADSAAWVVSLDDPAGKCDVAPSATVAPRIIEIHGPGKNALGITVAGKDGAGDAATSVSFNGYGQTVGAKPLVNIEIEHSDTSQRKLRVEISASGSIRMCDPAVDQAGVPKDARACNNPV
jgi:type IV fimbrial biogenesis protein FimT